MNGYVFAFGGRTLSKTEFSKYINVDLNIVQAENVYESKKLLFDRDIDILVGFDIKENDSNAKKSYPYHESCLSVNN